MDRPYEAVAVANWFLDRARQTETTMTQMKLHKLIYFAHGWALGFTQKPLISEEIEAWDYGPVVPSVYHKFKHHGADPITELAEDVVFPSGRMEIGYPSVPAEDEQATQLLDLVWDVYGSLTAARLSYLTHLENTPWSLTRREFGNTRGVGIRNEEIKDYFVHRLRESETPGAER